MNFHRIFVLYVKYDVEKSQLRELYILQTNIFLKM